MPTRSLTCIRRCGASFVTRVWATSPKARSTPRSRAPGSRWNACPSRLARMNAIELRDIRRVYNVTTGTLRRHAKAVVALDGLSLDVPEGELFGLLGPNG